MVSWIPDIIVWPTTQAIFQDPSQLVSRISAHHVPRLLRSFDVLKLLTLDCCCHGLTHRILTKISMYLYTGREHQPSLRYNNAPVALAWTACKPETIPLRHVPEAPTNQIALHSVINNERRRVLMHTWETILAELTDVIRRRYKIESFMGEVSILVWNSWIIIHDFYAIHPSCYTHTVRSSISFLHIFLITPVIHQKKLSSVIMILLTHFFVRIWFLSAAKACAGPAGPILEHVQTRLNEKDAQR